MFLKNIAFISLIYTIHFVKSDDELLAVNLLYRHGDRAPLRFYPNDPYKDPSLWPAQLGELTNLGKRQMYDLGKWMRNRYDGFLSQIFDTNEIYIRSSDENRCIMSAQANLAGLYPPKRKDIWTNDILWQPIPVHTIPQEEDDIAEGQTSCKKLNKLLIAAENQLQYYKDVNEENKNFYRYLSEKSGYSISELIMAGVFYDILNIEVLYNLRLPDWANESYQKLENLTDISLTLFTCTPKLARIYTGRFYDNLISQFSQFAFKKENSDEQNIQKFKIFAAHDFQVVSLLNALKVKNVKYAPYAATVIFELRKSKENKLYVQVLYKTKGNTADVVKIKDCDAKCDLDEFLNIIKPLTLTKEEYKKECS